MHLTTSVLLSLTLAVRVSAQTDDSDSGLNFASWSSHMSRFPQETYCPQTKSNSLESKYEDCRSTAWDMVYSCPNGRDDASSRTACICSSINAMSSCLTAYCPMNTVVESVLSKDQDDYTSIYRCPSRIGAAGGGGGGNSNNGPASPTGTATPSRNVGAGGPGPAVGVGSGWTVGMAVVLGGIVGVVAVVL